MKLRRLALIAAIASGCYAGNVHADHTNQIQMMSCDCGQPVCGCETVAPCDTGCCDDGCDLGGCDSCGSGCGFGCDLGLGDCLGGCGDCCLGDPYSLFGEYRGWTAGGWMQLGYHTAANGLFNTRPDEVQLQQAWLYAERAIDTSCGFDIGGRIDYLYGTDGPNTQAFGTEPRGWDNDWDNGSDYGHAIPQLYMEAGYGDMSVKVGHFYTIIGYEVVAAPDNFFYSHAYTFNNSEPFTHTGALATYNYSDDVTIYGGYVLGWDSGDAFLGGIALGLTEDLTVTYATVAGRFAEPWPQTAPGAIATTGYMHSIVADYAVTDSLQYIFQSDLLESDFVDDTLAKDTIGINQYLIKTINDCWAVGARFEWWQVADATFADGGVDHDVYALTLGVNHRPHANVIVRPEIRWDWDEDSIAGLEDGDDEQTTFGVDTILTF